jgi:hypothetical protein
MNEKITIWGATYTLWQWAIIFALFPITSLWITFKYIYPQNKKLVTYSTLGAIAFSLLCYIPYYQQENNAFTNGTGTEMRNGSGDSDYLLLFENPKDGSYGATINERNYYAKHPEADTGWKKELDPVPEELKLENAMYGWLDMNYEH